MFIKRLLQFNLIVSALTAVSFVAFPSASLALYGLSGGGALHTMAQYFGSTHLAFALLLGLALKLDDARFTRIIATSFFAGDLAGSAILLAAQLRGTMNSMGWVLVALSLIFMLGYGYGALRKPPLLLNLTGGGHE